jgi:hypothetical protein
MGQRVNTSAVERAARDLVRLASTKPRSPSAGRLRIDLEHQLLRILTGGGPRALERVIKAARRQGLSLQPERRMPELKDLPRGSRAWEQEVPSRNGVLTVRGHASRTFRYISVHWTARRAALTLTPAQQRRHQEQEAFYARYTAAGQRAYASPPKRISALERSILLIGELEADVNNGGFDQYLDNKGRRRAGEAMEALRRVGAKATARLLEAALKPGVSDAARSRLDDRFYEGKEDLALLASRAFHLTDKERDS